MFDDNSDYFASENFFMSFVFLFFCPWIWLTQILKILHCMDPSEWLPQTECCIHLTPKEFLNWTMDIASNERFAPNAPCANPV